MLTIYFSILYSFYNINTKVFYIVLIFSCERHPQIPSFCTLVQDPKNACCQTVFCPIKPTPGPNVTPLPYTGVPTPAPTGPVTPGPYVTPAPLRMYP